MLYLLIKLVSVVRFSFLISYDIHAIVRMATDWHENQQSFTNKFADNGGDKASSHPIRIKQKQERVIEDDPHSYCAPQHHAIH